MLYDLKINCEKNKDPNLSAPAKIVMYLIGPLLDQDCILFTDKFYTSVRLVCDMIPLYILKECNEIFSNLQIICLSFRYQLNCIDP